ncbi:hypothetical protein EZV73_25565 [Acidaminobacter sp. JC074]|uniref:hypothetical protein n=1 Tax=Acidaminobacter sp. JC074 TaxID=2530199 RepID=UPI001F1103CE|nr:hypothetical protein [Acidaminobacter sp. JC074]MCH4890972.1 hypothetical protein [Acidaminobacter sp. JC074]
MNEPIIDGNCGIMCGYHCCRSHEDEASLGMYLLPLEYEAIQKDRGVDFEVHSSYDYEIHGAKKLFYIFCNNNSGCLRNYRPVQCRTYPLEPHFEDGQLKMIIEKNQLHTCPLIENKDIWRKEFIKGIYAGWELLLTLEPVSRYIEALSEKRKDYLSYVKPVD